MADERPAAAAGDQQQQQQPGERGAQDPGARERGPGAPEPGKQPPDGMGAAPAPGDAAGEPPPSPTGALRRLAERQRSAAESQRLSERMRELARRMAEAEERGGAASPPEAEAGSREAGLGGAPLRRSGDEPFAPEGTEDLDLGGTEPATPMAGELLGAGEGQGPLDREAARRVVREARHVAERAVDESVVPSRYHRLIRRYFGRLGERSEQ
jgi:hypothetical protein